MTHFIHAPDGTILISTPSDSLALKIDKWLELEPTYELPEQATHRIYRPSLQEGSQHLLYSADTQWPGEEPWTAGDRYIENINVYRLTVAYEEDTVEDLITFPRTQITAAYPKTLRDAKSLVRNQIRLYANRLRVNVIGPVNPGETSAWFKKELEAKAVFQSELEDIPEHAEHLMAIAPLLYQESRYSGRSIRELAARVESNAAAWLPAEAAIAGCGGMHLDAINQLETIEEVLAYDWSEWGPFTIPNA